MTRFAMIVPGNEIQGLRIRKGFANRTVLQVCYNLIDVSIPGHHKKADGCSQWKDVEANNLEEVTAVSNLLAKLNKG